MPALAQRIRHSFKSNLIVQVLTLAIAYALLGRLSLLLAIPPGYAIAVYPPAGLALGIVLTQGYRLLPGVFLGSFLVNFSIGLESGNPFYVSCIGLPLLLASGASLQAYASTYVIRAKLRNNLALDIDRDIFRFFIWGGLAGCLISSTIGISALYHLDVISSEQILGNWLTWWTGDTLGELTITPIVLILLARPRKIWLSRRHSVMLPLVICLLTVFIAFVFIRQREEQKQHLEFRLEAARLSQSLQNKLDVHADTVKNIERFFAASKNVTRTDFNVFTEHTLQTHKAISALLWIPRVAHEDRQRFEEAVLQEGFIHFQITEKNPSDEFVRARNYQEYFPVTFIEPFAGTLPYFGYDLGTSPVSRNAIEEARDSGSMAATNPIALISEKDSHSSVMLFAPIYAQGKALTTREDRERAFKGSAVSVVSIKNMVADLLAPEEKKLFLLKFYDLSYPGVNGIFYDTISEINLKFLFQSTIDFGGRQYAFLAQPSRNYWDSHVSWITWSTMIGGLMFSGLLGIYLLVATAHTFNVEILVAQRTSQLHDSEERLSAILSNAAEGIVTTDMRGFIASANQSAEALFAYPPGTLFGRNIRDLFPDATSNAYLQSYFSDEFVHHGIPIRIEVTGRKRGNIDFPLELALAKVELGTQNLLVLILHDLSEQKRIEKLKSEFVSTVSHELRTPLTSIRGALGLLMGGVSGTLPESIKKLIQMANDNASRLTLLINDLLDFEKLEYGGMQFQMERIQLHDLVKSIVDANLGYAQNFSIKLLFETEQVADMPVNVDTQRFTQVLSNLLSNAIKFSPKNGQVAVEITRLNDWVRIEVIDYGIGISTEFQKNIFQKFSQEDAKAARKYAGTGLGLSLSKSMIEKMGGEIGFTSVEGRGSRFYLDLPLASS
ncbi:CHASE domain-containing protein [Undibacterium sp. Jales W-56]|uniref:CHASE domain-containing protein n=1 Tax=Undibacterium sp. Jales W-56 TaxID=2897325 RepID=UPI0021D28F68|nr:CHASE domain-containing protein [Undibacterium sp. Jales W-56]MCU6432808.1 CHASE domain-containing protein [Undibacterium sp. Jales W-56]